MNNLREISLIYIRNYYPVVSRNSRKPGVFCLVFLGEMHPHSCAHLQVNKEQSSYIKITDRKGIAETKREGGYTQLRGWPVTLFSPVVEMRDSRIRVLVTSDSRRTERGESGKGSAPIIAGVSPYFILSSKTSIKQYLPVPAMSTLTTGDLEINSISIVTYKDSSNLER